MRPRLTVLERMVATAVNEAWIETYNCLEPSLIKKVKTFTSLPQLIIQLLLFIDYEEGSSSTFSF